MVSTTANTTRSTTSGGWAGKSQSQPSRKPKMYIVTASAWDR